MTNHPFLLLLSLISLHANAQEVTYNHDENKMNQFTVMEIGEGELKPDLYYTIFHNGYKKDAAVTNKTLYRTNTGVSALRQVEDADSIKSAMEKRAEIEALNVADRQIDIAWQTEGTKIEAMLQRYETNISRIIEAGGTSTDQSRWTEYDNVFRSSITATKEAYMPNSQRKKQYLSIYADITEKNDLLVTYIEKLVTRKKTKDLLCGTYTRNRDYSSIATTAKDRWTNSSKNKEKQ